MYGVVFGRSCLFVLVSARFKENVLSTSTDVFFVIWNEIVLCEYIPIRANEVVIRY
jgi:hypothetical protein